MDAALITMVAVVVKRRSWQGGDKEGVAMIHRPVLALLRKAPQNVLEIHLHAKAAMRVSSVRSREGLLHA